MPDNSIWGRMPIWLRWITGIALFLWVVPPMVLVAIKVLQ